MSKNEDQDMLDNIAEYYSAKILAHGATPEGVDWNGQESQQTRFAQLSQCITDNTNSFSINDLGCGYGAYYDYLTKHYSKIEYNGWDISGEMIKTASKRYADLPLVNFAVAAQPTSKADYSVASGIFNVRLKHSNKEWLEYINATLKILDQTSTRGFAFNCLTIYSDEEKMRDYLYYADPCALFDYCKKRFSRNVALLHDYDLYEFTLLIRKE